MPPLAPWRLSTTMFWLSAMPSGWAMMRVTMSVPLPAPNGTMMVMGRLGYASATAITDENVASPMANMLLTRALIRTHSKEVLSAVSVPVIRYQRSEIKMRLHRSLVSDTSDA